MNWDKHFQRLSAEHRAQKRGAVFGAVGGKTISDLRDLVKAKDELIARLENQIRPPVAPDIIVDWNALKVRYKIARAKAAAVLDHTGGFLGHTIDHFVEGTISAADEFDGILKALQQSYPELRVSKGDATDIVKRLGAIYHSSGAPQPEASASDMTFQAADAAAKYMPTPGKALVATIDPELVPETANKPSYRAAQKQMSAFGGTLTTVALLAGGVVVVAMLVGGKATSPVKV